MPSFDPIVRRRRLVLLAYVALAAACIPGLLRLKIDNTPERFLVRDARELQRLRDLELPFGRDRAVRLVLPGEAVWSGKGLDRLAAIEERVLDPWEVGGGVYGAGGLYRQHRWHLPAWPPADPEAFRDLALSDPLDRNAGWVSRDGRYVTVLAGLFKMRRERGEATLAALETLLPEGGFVVGIPVVNRALDRALEGMVRQTLPLLLAVATALLMAAFRRRMALLPLALVAVSQTVLFGAMGYAGQRLDIVTVLLAPLVFVIALATGTHVLAYHQRLVASGLHAGEAVLETYRTKAWPVFWTGMTTCAGFGSLAVSPVPPVRLLGLWAAFGIAYLTLAALSFYPALLVSAGGGGGAAGPGTASPVVARLGRAGGALAAVAVRRRRTIFGAFGVVALLAAAGLPRLEVETNVLTYLHPEHPARVGIAAVEEAGVGAVSASVVVARPGGAPLTDPDAVRRLAALAEELRDEPLVLGAVSPGDILAAVARLDPELEDAGAAADLATARRRVEATPDLDHLLGYLESEGGERSRILLTTRMRSYRELEPLYHRATALAIGAFPDADVGVSGLYPLVLAAQRSLLRTMVLSLALALGVIAAMLRGLLSTALTWRALVPNLWAVLLVVGAMGWSGVPVDSATVIVAAVVLGLAVDDTLHTLGHFRRLAEGRSAGAAAVQALTETAAGHVATSAILALGFAACALSPLVPVARFGALAAVGIAGALASDLLLVPALLTLSARASATRRRRPGAGGSGSPARGA